MADEAAMAFAHSTAEGGVFQRPGKKLSPVAVAFTTKLPGSREKSMRSDWMLTTDRGESVAASKALSVS